MSINPKYPAIISSLRGLTMALSGNSEKFWNLSCKSEGIPSSARYIKIEELTLSLK